MSKWGGVEGSGRAFRVDRLPARVQTAFSRAGASWRDAVEEAIRGGVGDPSALADLVFFLQHRGRVVGALGRPIDRKEDGFYYLRAEWNLYRSIASRRLRPSAACSVFLPPNRSASYEERVAAPTTGLVRLFVHGRTTTATGTSDQTGAFDDLQAAVESLSAGDSIYIAAWQFNPSRLALTVSRRGLETWGDLLRRQAEAGVAIRILMSDTPPGARFLKSSVDDCEHLVAQLPPAARDRFKYIVSMHPARMFDARKLLSHDSRSSPFTEVGIHHQKIVVLKKGRSTIAYCGGLELSPPQTPPSWDTGSLVWHDVHARLEGLIACDLERELVERWNRESDRSTAAPQPDWQPFETLTIDAPDRSDKALSRNPHTLQALRTVSVGTETADIRRDDIWLGYFQLIGCATRFLFLENQCFHEPRLADAIVKQAEAQPELVVIVVVSSELDPPVSLPTQHGPAVQHEFFARLVAGIPAARLGLYTMSGRLVHSKLILADDRALSLGSANANPRSFFLDSELNVMLDAPSAVEEFRHRLWAHDLGVPAATVARWRAADFIARWDAVAHSNDALVREQQVGECVVPFDPTRMKARHGPVSDVPIEA